MPPQNFMAAFGKRFYPAKVKRALLEIGYDDDNAINYIINKHCKFQTREWCNDFLHISPDQQRTIDRDVTRHICDWYLDLLKNGRYNSFFSDSDTDWLGGWMQKLGIHPRLKPADLVSPSLTTP